MGEQHPQPAAARSHAQATAFRTLHQHDPGKGQCKKKVDDEDDVFHMDLLSERSVGSARYVGKFGAGGKKVSGGNVRPMPVAP